MKKNYCYLFPLLFFAFSFSASAQPIFTVSEENMEESLHQIFEIYGDQIEIGYPQVYTFVKNMVAGTVTEDCEPPIPQIREVSQNGITFFWNPIEEANFYEGGYLNLINGDREPFETNNTVMSFTDQKGLVLFGFQSNCGEGQRGKANIIVADLDMLYPLPPLGETCECPEYETLSLYNPGTTFYSMNWPGKCRDNKYRVRLSGHFLDDNGSTNYYSELTFVHVQTSIPNLVFLLADCDINAQSDASPLFVGDPGMYAVSFTINDLNMELTPPFNFEVEELLLDMCDCNPKEDKAGERSLISELQSSDQIKLFPNPVNEELQLQIETEPGKPIDVVVVDQLGRPVSIQNNLTPSQEGFLQLVLNTDNWASGIYHVKISSPHNNQTIRFSKI